MEMFSSMTMPAIFFTGLLVLVVLGAALYIGVRVAGQRRAEAEHHPREAAPRTDRNPD
ncbi:hypothetical protein BH24ACT11_BH24ACT11_19340 [soil metagenome]